MLEPAGLEPTTSSFIRCSSIGIRHKSILATRDDEKSCSTIEAMVPHSRTNGTRTRNMYFHLHLPENWFWRQTAARRVALPLRDQSHALDDRNRVFPRFSGARV